MNAENGVDYWLLLAGIGIFLFGIHLLEESIRKLSGHAFKTFIRKYTSSPFKAILSGMFTTAVLQSSSAVSLMILAFAGAGIMQLSNAIGVILGSNVGTTMTSWIVATIGFKFNIDAFALPVVGIGGLLLIFFGSSERWANISKLLVGFGFLFMGLDYMKNSIGEIANIIDLESISGYPIGIYTIIGFALTVIVQSSSAAMAIILSVVFSGAIGFHGACAMVIGTNLGTTITVILGSIGGPDIKKQVALSHFSIKLVTGIVTFLLLPFLIYLIEHMGFKDDPVIGLAVFHTIFNLTGIIIFVPFLQVFAKFVQKIIQKKEPSTQNILSHVSHEIPEAALTALHKVYGELIELVMDHNLEVLKIEAPLILGSSNYHYIQKSTQRSHKKYELIKIVQNDLINFGSALQKSSLNEEESLRLTRLLHSIRFAVASAKTMKDIAEHMQELSYSENDFFKNHYIKSRKFILTFYQALYEIHKLEHGDQKLPSLLRWRQQVIEIDDKWMKSLTEYIGVNPGKNDEVDYFLSYNRGLILSSRQLISSIRDSSLAEEEARIFENV